MTLPWAFWEPPPEAISLVAEKFVLANGYPTTAVPDIVQARLGRGNLRAEHGTGEQVDNLFLDFSNFFGYG
jgi:hypothetical protein